MNKLKQLYNYLEKYWNEPKPTEEEIRVNGMMNILFNGNSTEQVIDTLILFDEKAKAKLKEIKQQAEKDTFVTDFYLGTNPKQTITI